MAKHNLSKARACAAVELSRSSWYRPVLAIEERDREVIIEWRGKPDAIHVDNGSEYISQVFADWCEEHDIKLNHIQPGKPNQNAYIERFNRTYRHEVLNAYVFESLRQVREITRAWITEYNEERPHDSLGKIPPAMFRRQVEKARNSTSELCH